MTEKISFPEGLVEIMRRFDQCPLPEIQTAFAAAAASTADEGEKNILNFLSNCAEQAKTSGSPEAIGNLAAIFGGADHFDVAIPLLEKACNEGGLPLNHLLTNLYNLGNLYSRTDRVHDALEAYEQVIQSWDSRLDTQDPKAFLDAVLDHGRNFELYDFILHETKIRIANTATLIGLDLHAEGRNAEARPYLEKALEYKEHLPTSQANAPTGEAPFGPTLH
jgi:tetratricopeptide (TPR) repeat protein